MLRLRGLLASDEGRIARDDITSAATEAERIGTELAERLASAVNLSISR
jgi:hypothetical protein